jgi:hypothetical protein
MVGEVVERYLLQLVRKHEFMIPRLWAAVPSPTTIASTNNPCGFGSCRSRMVPCNDCHESRRKAGTHAFALQKTRRSPGHLPAMSNSSDK